MPAGIATLRREAGRLGPAALPPLPGFFSLRRRSDDTLTVPVVGVASSGWTQAQSHAHVAASLGDAGATLDCRALAHLLSRLTYVSADYNDAGTFAAIKKALGRAPSGLLPRESAGYFAQVIAGLNAEG